MPLWKVEAGEGVVSPVVARGRMFLMEKLNEEETAAAQLLDADVLKQ